MILRERERSGIVDSEIAWQLWEKMVCFDILKVH
jgi:hypothetical protein